MADIKKIKVGGTQYNIKDETARNQLATKAPITSPSLTGTPTSTTPSSDDNSTRIATTAFVKNFLDANIGDISKELQNYQPIEFERFYKTTERMLLGSQQTRGGEQVETGTAKLSETSSIMGMTLVWNQLFDGANKTAQTVNGATYYCRINGVEEVFTSDGTATYERTSETAKDMLINLTHLYGANPLNLPLTMEQFKELFPLASDPNNGYYDYSEPRLMNTCVTQLQSSGKDKDGNVFTTNVNLPIQQLTGKLNGEGESVVIFPDGMAGTNYVDSVFKDNGVWKAIVRHRHEIISLQNRTWLSDVAGCKYFLVNNGSDYTTVSTDNNTKMIVASLFMSAARSQMPKDGHMAIKRQTTSNYNTIYIVSISDYEKFEAEGFPASVSIVRAIIPQTYILDDKWQTVFDEVWQTSYQGNETVYPINGTSPQTAPVRLNVEYPVIDYEVKRICVENWGGEYFDGEITPAEAARVTTLNSAFRGNTMIESFNEFRYFTGIKTFSHNPSNDQQGDFYNCVNLRNITIPRIQVTNADMMGLFRNCSKLESLDLSPIQAERYYINRMLYQLTSKDALKTVTLPGGIYGGTNGESRYARYAFMYNAGMVILNIDGVADWSNIQGFSEGNSGAGATSMFFGCSSFTTITGTITGISRSLSLQYSPLTVASALVILNGLATVSSTKTLTLKASMQSTYEADADFNAAVTSARAKGWEIAYA